MTVVEPEVSTNGAGHLDQKFTATFGNALVASAKRIDFGSDEDKKRYKRRQKTWQDESWRYYDECGEIWFAANFIANCLRKIRLFAAQQPDMSQPPIPIPDDAPGPLGDAVQNVERLGRADGGMGGLMAGLGLNLSVPGECVLVGSEDDMGIERWRVCSSDEVFVNSAGVWAIRGAPSDRKGTPLNPDTSVAYRIWRRHPRWSMDADSPMRAVLDVVEELLILSRAIRATGRSRLAGAGMLLWPSEASFGSTANPATNPETAGQPTDPVLADLMTAMLTPIGDEGTAAAVVPLLAKLPGERIAQVKHLFFDRKIDPQMALQRQELLKRIANGLDIPAEILLGLQDSNHWTAWQIDEQTFKAHLEPLVIQICGALTSEFLRPALGLDDPLESDVLVWYDASALIGHPNRTEDAKDAHDRYILSDLALLKYLGFPEEDMPSDEEIEARVARKSIERVGVLRTGETLGETTHVTSVEETQPGIPATGPAAGTETTAAPAPIAASARVITAASARTMSRLGWRLAHRDRDLRTRLTEVANAQMFRALERAGATLRRHTRRDAAVSAMIAGVENWEVAARLGPEAVASYGIDTQTVLEDSFDSLTMRFDREVQQAQQDLQSMIDDMDSGDDVDISALAARQAESRREAEGLLTIALLALANNRLFDPHPSAPALGEHSADLLVPPGYLREAMSIAGGGQVPSSLDGIVDGMTGGVLTGDLASEIWNQLGIGTNGYEWFTGAPDRPFEPHQDLDGTVFESFDDPVLASDPGEFPFVDTYFPGDHWGCECDFAPQLEEG